MKKLRQFKNISAGILSLTGIFVQSGCQQQQPEKKEKTPETIHLQSKPNILWISCEDISPRLGCYGDQVAQTPNLDQLANEGMRYTNVYTSAPVCAPCRTGIITGMYQTSIGCQHMRTSHRGRTGGLPTPYAAVPPHYVKAFTEYLRAAGYYCTNNSKTDYQFALGKTPETIWDESSQTAHYKNRPDKDQPFFAVFNYTVTHESHNWPDPVRTDPSDVSVPPYYPDTEPVRKDIARLYDNIAMLDTIVGEKLAELEELGLRENTVVFFWSDHGDGLPRGKRWLYDSGTKIPLIIRWPGKIKPMTMNNDLISSIDFGPTVLSVAGVPVPGHMQGKPFLGNHKAKPRDYVFSARDRFDESYDMIRSVRDNRYRYCRNYYPNAPYVLWVPYRNKSNIMQELLRLYAEDKLTGPQKNWFTSPRPAEELYDCIADPYQVNNLAEDPAYESVLDRMRDVLDEWRIESKDMGDISEEDMVRQMWPDGHQPVTHSPWIIPNTPDNRGAERIQSDSITVKNPTTFSLYCDTQGASFAYTTETGPDPHWLLYYKPLRFSSGTTQLRVKAVRYGYKESEIISCVIHIEE